MSKQRYPTSDATPEPLPYRVAYSGLVRATFLSFAARAKEHGLGAHFLTALKEFDRRLRIYPQFGEPLCDLLLEQAQLWIGVVRPLVLHYVLDEEKRLVMVATPPLLLPKSGF